MAAIGVHLPQLVERPTPAAVATAVECAVPHCAHGTAEQVRERIAAYADAGAHQIHLWPAADPLAQIEALAEAVLSRA